MKTMLGFVFLALTASAFAAEPAVTLTTTDGHTVTVSETAVRQAYATFVHQGPINQTAQNEDGTISIINVRVSVAGLELPVSGYADVTSLDGLCKLKGYGVASTSSQEWSAGGESTQLAGITPSGTITLTTGNFQLSTVICNKQ